MPSPEPLPPAAAPDIQVTPPVVDFGEVRVGDHAEVLVTIENVGTAVLDLTGSTLVDPASPFEVEQPGRASLAPGETTTFPVRYQPVARQPEAGQALVLSEDPRTPEVAVELLGSGVAPAIALDPVEHDFGTCTIGESATLEVNLRNDGDADLTVSAVSYTSSSIDLTLDLHDERNGALPWTLAPGSGVVVDVSYLPSQEESALATLSVRSDDPVAPVVLASQWGMGEWGSCDFEEFPSDGLWTVTTEPRWLDPDSYMPTLDDFPTAVTGTQRDGEPLIEAQQYYDTMVGLSTWVLVDDMAGVTWDVAVWGDDSVGVWVDGEFLAGRPNAEAPPDSGSVTLGCGWHLVQAIVYNGNIWCGLHIEPTVTQTFARVASAYEP